MTELRKTALNTIHRQLGARLVPFAGWSMPVQYKGVIEEHQAVRTKAGLFDVSHMGEIRIRGPQALDLVQWVTTNDAGKLTPGKAQYSLFCTPEGTIVDDIIVYCLDEKDFLICVNAANTAKDFTWAKENAKSFDASLEDQSSQYAQLALQGPLSQEILQGLSPADLASLQSFCFLKTQVAGSNCLLAQTGYTGEHGYELYMQPEKAPEVFQALLEKGGPLGLQPTGLAARDTLRLEMKYPLYGNDIDDQHSPLEAGLGWVVKLKKDDFLGKAALEKQKSQGVSRKWIGFRLLERGVPRHGYPVLANNHSVGTVTSGTHSPSLDFGIGCAYVPNEFAAVGTRLQIEIRSKTVAAEVVKTPFYQRNSQEKTSP